MRGRRLTWLAALLAGAAGAAAQPVPTFAWGHVCGLEAEHVDHHTRVDAPASPPWLLPPRGDAPLRAPTVFNVEYVGVPPEAQLAFTEAVATWGRYVSSPVPIRVRVTWAALETNTLANASPRLVANFAAALDRDTFYPVALANALQGVDLDSANPHIEVTFNANQRWSFRTDPEPETGLFDLVTVALHEIAHGLGFIGTARVVEGRGFWGLGPSVLPASYDRAAEVDTETGTFALVDTGRFPNPSAALAAALQSDRVYFSGPAASRAQAESQAAQGLPVGPGARPVLHAPAPWRPGSSFNHLTELTDGEGAEVYYPPGSINSLMTPRLGRAEVIRTPGPVTCGVLRDLGWPLGDGCLALLGEEPVALEEPLLVVGPCPNPAGGGVTRIGVFVAEPSRARVDVFDLAGRRVRTAYDGPVPAVQPTLVGGRAVCPVGAGSVEVPTDGLASGVYLVRVQARGVARAVRLAVVR